MSTFAEAGGAERAPAPQGLPRLLSGLDPSGLPMSLEEHLLHHGPLPALGTGELIEAAGRSGLRGRGGADFPVSVKLRAVAGARRRAVVVVNGSETEPGSQKDRLLLTKLPHLVLDGAELAALALGSPTVIVKVRGSMPGAAEALEAARAVRARGPVGFTVALGPDGYVTGEESAVVNLLDGGPALPTFAPPRVFERGIRGRPTLMQNPETLAALALVARHGPRWYRELGTDADPGSVLVTICGAVRAPGVYELAFGTSLTDLLRAAGGPGEPLRALLVGGLFGTWLDARRIPELHLARTELRAVGCSLGSGVLFALGSSSCGLHESATVIEYLAAQSAGQCGPCVHGLAAMARAFDAVADGVAGPDERERILRWSGDIAGRGACHHPDGATRFVRSALSLFGEDPGHPRSRCGAPSSALLGRR